MSQLLRTLSQSLNTLGYSEFSKICIKISLTPLKSKEQRSFNSLKIKYFIDNSKFDDAKTIIDTAPNLMKRDYLNYLNYLYKVNTTESHKMFSSIIHKYEFLNKDIEFIIDNKMFGLLYHLENFYNSINSDINEVEDLSCMKHIVPVSEENTEKILSYT